MLKKHLPLPGTMYKKGKETGVDEIPGIQGGIPGSAAAACSADDEKFFGLWFLISQYHFLKQNAITLSVRTATPAKILRFFTAAQYQKKSEKAPFSGKNA